MLRFKSTLVISCAALLLAACKPSGAQRDSEAFSRLLFSLENLNEFDWHDWEQDLRELEGAAGYTCDKTAEEFSDALFDASVQGVLVRCQSVDRTPIQYFEVFVRGCPSLSPENWRHSNGVTHVVAGQADHIVAIERTSPNVPEDCRERRWYERRLPPPPPTPPDAR